MTTLEDGLPGEAGLQVASPLAPSLAWGILRPYSELTGTTLSQPAGP